MLNRLIGYFITGIALIAPIFLTVWVLYYIYDGLSKYCNAESVVLGILIFIVGVSLVGYLAPFVLSNIIWKNFEGILFKIPLFGPIYKATKELTTSIVGSENKFSEPVSVEINGNGLYKLGFITCRDITVLSEDKGANDLVMVYFPISFSLSGDMYLVPLDKITLIDRKAKDVMQIIVSGGLIKSEPVE